MLSFKLTLDLIIKIAYKAIKDPLALLYKVPLVDFSKGATFIATS
jgi:hypothetical protein